ncbi:MAG: AAA family ATPase [Dermatophilaceae bacterium]
MTILWDSDPAAAETYHFAVGDHIEVVEAAQTVTRALTTNPQELLVIVGPDVDLQAASSLAEQVRNERPEVSVILLRRRLDVAVLTQALRAGFREVVAADDLTALSDACRRSLEVSHHLAGISGVVAAVREGKVVTVFNTKGGCGKTTVATNLGAYVASTGARVLLVDLDLASGDVAISLQLRPQASVGDLVAMSGHIDKQGLASVVTKHDSGLDTVCAPSRPGEADRISGAAVGEMLRVARRSYEYVIIDTPPAFSEHVLAAFDVCDLAVLLATLDIPAVKNLKLTLDTLDLLGHPRDARIVILNRSDAKVGLRTEDVVAAIKQPIAAMIPSSSHVPASVNRGVPIVLDEPKHPVSLALRAFADQYILSAAAPSLSASQDSGEPLAQTRRSVQQPRREMRLFRRGVK